MRPTSVNILGKVHTITYVDKPSDVDIYHRQSLLGQIDHWTHSIRVYDSGDNGEEILDTILHEVLHGIVTAPHMCDDKMDDEDTISLLAMALADTLIRNGWLKDENA